MSFIRKRPARGVKVITDLPTIVFVTAVTRDRKCWLADEKAHKTLVDVWQDNSAWFVGRYILMPDHVHFFCAPAVNTRFSLQHWITYWKRMVSKGMGEGRFWQSDCWDTRLRRGDSYSQKWAYVRNNPVRKGLVSDPDEWPYQGEMYRLSW